jgi:hypothetical protein
MPKINIQKPIEMDDGTPVTFLGTDKDGDLIIKLPAGKYPFRIPLGKAGKLYPMLNFDGAAGYNTYYYTPEGKFQGRQYEGNPDFYRLRNVTEVSLPSLLGWTLPCGAEVIEEEMKYDSPNAHENPYLSVSFDKDPRHIRGGFSERFDWHFTPTGEHHYGAFSNLTPPVPTPTAPPAFAPEKPALFTYGIDYRLDRSGYVLVNTPADGWVRLGQTRSRLFLGIISLLRVVDLEVVAGRAHDALRAVAEIGTRNLLSDLTRETRAVQRDTMASLFETLQALLASLGDPEGKTEWKRAT